MKAYIPTINISSLIKNNFNTKKANQTIKEIEKAVRDGKKIICFNKDITFPTENGEKPGNGAVVQIIEKDLGIVINSLGKPDDYYIKYFLDNNIQLDFVIGDRVDTNIFFGTKLNAKTFLVNSGVSNFEDVNNADFVIESFSKIVASPENKC